MTNKKIRIENVKSIGLLEFDLPDPGVYVLTGENGCGKTTLLACITRLGQRDSFPRHFRTSNASQRLDNFDASAITYIGPQNSVIYKYSGYRWEPTPKGNSKGLLAQFGYSEVLYVAADDKRVTPRQEDFKPSRIQPADGFVVSYANKIFGTEKFDALRVVNVRRGPGQQAFVFEKQGTKPTFYSERNFSLGELAVLKLLRVLSGASNKALLVIDELELALYPLAQERLLTAIREIAKSRELTVIFSTHSATLIRSVSPENLLFLERQGSSVVCATNCYPAYALGRIGSPGEAAPEKVILVEDLVAEAFVQAALQPAAKKIFAGCAPPAIQVVPIGGYENVLKFLNRAGSLFSSQTSVRAALDKDCESILILKPGDPNPPVGSQEAKVVELFQKLSRQTKFLPETPEVGLMNAVSKGWPAAMSHLSQKYFNHTVSTLPAPVFSGSFDSKPDRKAAKASLDKVLEKLASCTGRSDSELLRELFSWYVESQELKKEGWAAAMVAPLVK